MSSSSGTSMVALAAPTYHHHLRQTSLVKPVTSSTIYHSPQSSPTNDQSTPTPPPLPLTSNSSSSTLMLTNNNNEDDRIEQMDDHDDEDEEKPLDFSSKSSSPPPLTGSKGTSDNRKLLDQQELPRAKKIHQKYLANKQQQQQQTAAEHCFTTPSPSPPEHRISSSTTNNSQISMAKITDESRYSFGEVSKNNPNDNDGILSKLFQGLSHIQNEQNVCPSPPIAKANTLPPPSLINETLLNQALQLAKLQQQPIVDSSTMDQQTATAHLINLLTQAHQQPMQNPLKLIANHPQTTSFPMMPVSPMKPILASPPRSLSPSTFPETATRQQLDQQNHPTSAKGHAAFISNGTTGGLLTAASTNTTNTTASESAFLGSSNLLSTLPKYTRPFKALYNKSDHSLASMLNHHQQQQPISPQSSSSRTSPQSSTAAITSNVASTTTFPPLESLTAQSILNSNQAYKMFRSRMLSPSTSPLIGTKPRNSRLSSNGGKTQNKNNNSRSFSFQLKSENSDDTSSSDSSFNATTAFLDNSSQSPINHNHVNGQTILLEQTNNNSQKSTTSINNKNGNTILPIMKSSGLSSPSLASTVPTTVGNGGRKRGRPLPDDLKDEAYWERRRKNNEAAKRSRDLRRAKEDEIAIRACFLEQENRQLKCELIQVKLELDKMKTLLATLQSSQPAT